MAQMSLRRSYAEYSATAQEIRAKQSAAAAEWRRAQEEKRAREQKEENKKQADFWGSVGNAAGSLARGDINGAADSLGDAVDIGWENGKQFVDDHEDTLRTIGHIAVTVGAVALGFGLATAFCAGTGGAGCVILASAAFGATYGTLGNATFAAVTREKVSAGEAAMWPVDSAMGGGRSGWFMQRFGKSPVMYAWDWVKSKVR
jgi:hypothetical protein